MSKVVCAQDLSIEYDVGPNTNRCSKKEPRS